MLFFRERLDAKTLSVFPFHFFLRTAAEAARRRTDGRRLSTGRESDATAAVRRKSDAAVYPHVDGYRQVDWSGRPSGGRKETSKRFDAAERRGRWEAAANAATTNGSCTTPAPPSPSTDTPSMPNVYLHFIVRHVRSESTTCSSR